MTDTPNIPADLYDAISRAMSQPQANTESVARAVMDVYGQRSKRERMHMVMDGCISEMQRIKDEARND